MKRWIRAAGIFLFMLHCGNAAACPKESAWGTASGRLVDARDPDFPLNNFSEADQEIYHKAAAFGPLLVLIEEGTGRVRPFYYGPEDVSIMEGVESAQPYVGHRVRLNACIANDPWPSLLEVSNIEILD